MPIIQPTNISAPVFYPESNYTVVKYLDLTKFLSLLQNQSLFFCRLDKLEDQFEGTTAKANFDIRVRWHKQTNHLMQIPLTDDEIIKQVEFLYEHERKLKALNCVNCWNKKDGESAALWKIYSDFGKGIMLKSSIEDEVRLIYELMPEFDWDYDWSKEDLQEGVYIKTDLAELIDEIIIGPYSPKWFLKLVEDISEKYGLTKPINKSQLSLT